MTVICGAASIEAFDAAAPQADVVLLDLHLPGIEGAEGVKHVVEQGHRVLVVSAAGGAQDVIDAVAAGAIGYLTKDADDEDIQRAVKAVAAGRTTFRRPWRPSHHREQAGEQPDVSASRASWRSWRSSPRRNRPDIAKQLHLATATVYSHLERIRDKTGASRRAQLTRLYLEDHGKGKRDSFRRQGRHRHRRRFGDRRRRPSARP